MAYNEGREGKARGERHGIMAGEREGKGVRGGRRVRQCEVTPLPLAVRCLLRTGAAAGSDCTPLKQRALVI